MYKDFEFFVGVFNANPNSQTIFNFNTTGDVWIKQNDSFIKTNEYLNGYLIVNGNSDTLMGNWEGAGFYSSNNFYPCVLAYGKYLVATNLGNSFFCFDLRDCNYPFDLYQGKNDIWFAYDAGNDRFYWRKGIQSVFKLDDNWKNIDDSSFVGIWQIKELQPNLTCFLSAPDSIVLSWENNYLKISWDRIDLENVDSYYIYKSVEGSEILARIEPQQMNGERQSWIDYSVTKPKRTDPMFLVNYRIKTRTTDSIFSNFSPRKSIYGNTGIWKIGEKSETEEVNFQLNQNTPNPFNPTTTIKYSLPEQQFVSLKIFDILGNEVATLVNENKPAGNYEVNFDASNLSSGVYFYQLRAGNFTETKKMLLMK